MAAASQAESLTCRSVELTQALRLFYAACTLPRNPVHFPRMTPIADIIGANAKVQVFSAPNLTHQSAAVVVFVVTGSGTVRLGDTSVTASLGIPIIAGSAPFVYPYHSLEGRYGLAQIYAYVPTGATLSVAYA